MVLPRPLIPALDHIASSVEFSASNKVFLNKPRHVAGKRCQQKYDVTSAPLGNHGTIPLRLSVCLNLPDKTQRKFTPRGGCSICAHRNILAQYARPLPRLGFNTPDGFISVHNNNATTVWPVLYTPLRPRHLPTT